MDEIRCVLNEYDPKLDDCVVGFSEDLSYVYKLEEDENGNLLFGKYLLDAVRRAEGLTNVECMAG